MKRLAWCVVILLLAAALAAPARTYAQDLGQLIKVLGIGFVVRQFGPQINSFINTLLQNNNVATRDMTKVVPILNVAVGINQPGSAYIGAAQVSGPQERVNQVQAVALLEADFQNAFRIKALVPVDSLEPWKGMRRVLGVGVSAVIDLKI